MFIDMNSFGGYTYYLRFFSLLKKAGFKVEPSGRLCYAKNLDLIHIRILMTKAISK